MFYVVTVLLLGLFYAAKLLLKIMDRHKPRADERFASWLSRFEAINLTGMSICYFSIAVTVMENLDYAAH